MNSSRITLIGLTLPMALLAAAPAIARMETGMRAGMTLTTGVAQPGYPYPSPGPVSPTPRYLDPPPPYGYPPGTPVYPQPGYAYPAPGYAYPAPGYPPGYSPGYPPRPAHPPHPRHPPPPDWRARDHDRDGVPDRWDRRPYDPWRR